MTRLEAPPRVGTAASGEKPRRTLLVVSAAGLFPILYLVFVGHYGRNIFQFDDWYMAPVVSRPLSWGAVWAQYGEPRIVVDRLAFLADARLGSLDLRHILFLSAVVWILSYVGALVLFRRYLGRPLTALSVLALGAVWFSLADVQNALWAFQTGWFFVVLGFIGMTLALLLPRGGHPFAWLLVGAVSAFVGTIAWIQGFVLWPLGLLCILWASQPKITRRRRAALWCAAFAVVTVTYLIGYDRRITSCVPAVGCVPESPLSHPLQAVQFALTLLGNLIPGPYQSDQTSHFGFAAPQNLLRFELLGACVLVAALWVVVGSIRSRHTTDRLPVPLLLVSFGLLVDFAVTWGRVGSTPMGAIYGNRYVMANLVLLAGVVMYTWAHATPTTARRRVGVGVLACFVVFQAAWSTVFGISSARHTDVLLNASARTVVNIDAYPEAERTCELFVYLIPEHPFALARANRLAEFGQTETYRRQGAPAMQPPC